MGSVVVKLFGETFDGARAYATELAMYQLLSNHPEVPAPDLVATGDLFDAGSAWRWPYLFTQRLEGVAIRDAHPSAHQAREIAEGLGEIASALHGLPAPTAVSDRDLIPDLRSNSAERCQRFGLPEALVEQVPGYLATAPPADTLVHADITADHVFVDGDRVVGIIDWGDAIVADVFYELTAVYFDALHAQPDVLRSFLDGYGWSIDANFPKGALHLHAVLEFQFDAILPIRELVDLDGLATLDALADAVFGQFPR